MNKFLNRLDTTTQMLLGGLLALLICLPFAGCPSTVNAPTPPTAPDYSSPQDQQFGQALAAARALDYQATLDYGRLPAPQQAQEKNALNGFTAAVNAADALYQAYHVGQATPQQVQDALTRVNSAQTAFTNVAVK